MNFTFTMLPEHGKGFEFRADDTINLRVSDIVRGCMSVSKRIVFFLFPLIFSCSQNKKATLYSSPSGYDLTNPVIIYLKPDLDEISGIFYYPKDTSIFAVNDEQGLLYKIYIRKKIRVKKWRFSGERDFEDIVLHDSVFYALQSNGNVKSFTFLSKDSLVLDDCSVPLFGKNEFETIYYDSEKKKIVLLCKDCQDDNKKMISSYAFDPADKMFSDSSFYTINASDIADELQTDPFKLKPSAAAIHPVTKDLYILSSVNKTLVIAGRSGKVKEVYRLNPAIFKQPEGITFSPAGDMMISNESAGLGAPDILIFTYKPLRNEKG